MRAAECSCLDASSRRTSSRRRGGGSGSVLRHANEARDGIQFFLPPLLFLVLLVFPLVHPSMLKQFKTDSHYYNCLRYPSVICACGWFRRLTAGGGVGARGAGP